MPSLGLTRVRAKQGQSMGFDILKLPSEVLVNVTSRLEIRDISSLRSTSAEHRLNEEIFLILQRKCLIDPDVGVHVQALHLFFPRKVLPPAVSFLRVHASLENLLAAFICNKALLITEASWTRMQVTLDLYEMLLQPPARILFGISRHLTSYDRSALSQKQRGVVESSFKIIFGCCWCEDELMVVVRQIFKKNMAPRPGAVARSSH
jgi:hypothetical protein